jgi:cytochrome c oxidase assembly factor CtaG
VGLTTLPLADANPINGIVPSVIVLLCWLPYHARVRTLSDQRRAVPAWRQACFAAGLITLAIALSAPVDSLADQLLVAHMAEHLVIGDISALLIVLGFTGPLLAPLLRIRWLAPLRVFAHPLVALPAWIVSFYVWHLPALYQAALRHDLIHGLQHACFLAFGIAVWMALLGPLPKPAWFGNAARLAYIIVVRLAGTVLANVLIFSGTVLYPIYRTGDAHWHISPMGDQIAAAGLMMVEESLLTIGLFCWLFLKVAREAEERQTLVEAAAARGVELDERRAARAVAAGRGQELLVRVTRGGPAELPPEPAEAPVELAEP